MDQAESVEELYFTSHTSLDEKNRIIIPKHVRTWLQDNPVLCHGPAGSLALYRKSYWEEHKAFVRQAPRSCLARGEYERAVLSTQEPDIKFDPQGRMVISKSLKALARLNKEVVLKGICDYVEIWSETELEVKMREHDSYYNNRFAQVRLWLDEIEEAVRGERRN